MAAIKSCKILVPSAKYSKNAEFGLNAAANGLVALIISKQNSRADVFGLFFNCGNRKRIMKFTFLSSLLHLIGMRIQSNTKQRT